MKTRFNKFNERGIPEVDTHGEYTLRQGNNGISALMWRELELDSCFCNFSNDRRSPSSRLLEVEIKGGKELKGKDIESRSM